MIGKVAQTNLGRGREANHIGGIELNLGAGAFAGQQAVGRGQRSVQGSGDRFA